MLDPAVLNILNRAIGLHKSGKLDQAIDLYNRILNRYPNEENLLYLLSDAFLRKEYNGLSVAILRDLLSRNPANGEAWCNLGVAYRKENFTSEAVDAWYNAFRLQGDSVEVCSNMAGLYADRGKPDEAIYWSTRALRCDPGSVQAHWHLSLAQLTKREWSAGWENYAYRMKGDTWDGRKTIDAKAWCGEVLSDSDRLYLHGEQGVGDEVHFLQLLPRVMERVKNITVEVHRKVADIVRAQWPSVEVITSEQEADGNYTHKMALGSLCAIWWGDDGISEPWVGEPFIKPRNDRVAHYQRELCRIGPRPWVAIAWIGGLKATRIEDRSIPLSVMSPLLRRFTCVSAQYEDVNPLIGKDREEFGIPKIDDLCVGGNLMEQADFLAACDYVVTVAQTAMHVGGAVGAETLVMLPHNPDWRYGLDGEEIEFYKSVKLFRRAHNVDDWAPQIAEVIRHIKKDYAKRMREAV